MTEKKRPVNKKTTQGLFFLIRAENPLDENLINEHTQAEQKDGQGKRVIPADGNPGGDQGDVPEDLEEHFVFVHVNPRTRSQSSQPCAS